MLAIFEFDDDDLIISERVYFDRQTLLDSSLLNRKSSP